MEENKRKEEILKETNKKENKKKSVKVLIIFTILIIAVCISVFVTIICSQNEIKNAQQNKSNINKEVSNENKCENVIDSQNNSVIIFDDYKDIIDYKPIIYLYPEEKTEITLKLGKEENLTCTYPKYEGEWKVIAEPDGTLEYVKTGRKLYALYWEGKNLRTPNFEEGFVIKGSDSIEFLEEKLEILGLNEREAEEFIVYWLPKLEANKYNCIRFLTIEEINESMPLEFSKNPDTLIRVFMEFKPLEEYIELPEQKLNTPERKGFVVVEWGGSEINSNIIK